MTVQNLTLAALNENASYKEENKYTALVQLIDARAKFGTDAAPSQNEYEALLKSVIKDFPNQNATSADIVACAWTQLIEIYMKNFFHNAISEKTTEEFKNFNQALSASNGFEKGIKIINLSQDSFLVPCIQKQQDLPLNNLEMTVAFNYAALEQIINSVYYFNEIDTNTESFCGLHRHNHSNVIELIGELAQHQYDFVYDLLWGASDEQYVEDGEPPHPSTAQRNKVINTSNLYALLK